MTGDIKRTLLDVKEIDLRFGEIQSLADVSLHLEEGELMSIIGPNGAGKSSLLNCISGYYKPQQGRIHFEGQDITSLPPYKITRVGIGRTYQNIELFLGMTVVENLLASRYIHTKYNFLWGALYFGKSHRQEIQQREVVEELIDFLKLETVRKKAVGTLPYGLRKRVELGRAIALEPKLLLLDEPMAGMNWDEKEDMARFIIDLREVRGKTIIMVEHDMSVVMDITDRVVVLDFGRKIAEGVPSEIQNNPEVIKAYLGVGLEEKESIITKG